MCGCCGGVDWAVAEEWERQQEALKKRREREKSDTPEVEAGVKEEATERG
ncbi:MAG: hypothetical protein QN193_05615 [Armatimonadota bacterium]|nr:hypothetical protein [Armatimonadota bacterium]MDR7443970.1 hypothetical protein [Armatimonadota bacterium]MDR7570068.1 hypothetical protein [Armatimonadota bacterium]MDR7615427.1 hypothetical protein [Armatimonadota bacterium]